MYQDESRETSGNTEDTRQAAARYLRHGLAVIPVPAGAKNPNRPGWQKERHTVEDVPDLWDNGQGIGILWGDPSGGLVDIDLDSHEARIAAPYILPPTKTFGRPGAPESHRVFRVTDGAPKPKKYKLPGDGPGRCILEVLSTGQQSLAPPSVHDSGEVRQWYQERSAAEVTAEVLMDGAADVASAALIARNWPGQGARHDYVLASAGYIGRRLLRDRAQRVMEAAIYASGDEEARGRLRGVEDTLEKIAAGTPTTGGPVLDNLAPGLVEQLQRWHGWRGERQDAQMHHHDGGAGFASFRRTDLGNAERLVARHGADLRYCHVWGKWLAWDGKRWAVDATGEVDRRAVETVASIYAEASAAHDKDDRKALARHAEQSESRSRIEAMIALAKSRPGIPIVPDELDADPWALNTASGTIDLRSGKLREHRREDLMTKMAPTEYDPGAGAPVFERFLERVLPTESVRQFLQRVVGYAAVGVVREEVLPILYGSGANGKTTLTGVLMEALGDYAKQAAPDLLMLKRGAHPTELSDLFGARFVVSTETEDGRRLAESVVKNLTGREKISARRMREDFWEFSPTHTVFLSTNHRPEVKGTDHAIWRRPKLIPFTVTIPDHEQDKSLPEKLRGELPGVLAWIVRGALQYQTGGLGVPKQVESATNRYRNEMDTLAAFFEDDCVIHPNAATPATPLYHAYQKWCSENGEAEESQKRFSSRLLERGFDSFRYTAGPQRGRKGWSGIGLRSDGDDGGPGDGEGSPEPSGRVNDQSRTNGDEHEQDDNNTTRNGEDRSQREGSTENRLHRESAIDMEHTPDSDDSVKDRERFSDISGSNVSREGVMLKNGSHPSHPSQTLLEDDDPVRTILADPPRWLATQLAKYRESPDRWKKPICAAVAAQVFGTAQRWREVLPILEEALDAGDATAV